jgi:two-component system, chemotaxis family, protein-glutamate methylesterase/glutaminase
MGAPGIRPGTKRIRALLVDDSAVVRRYLAHALREGGIEVVGAAPDPVIAWERISQERPDVLVLDVEMPRMDGITFLRKLMAERPLPVVMCSSLTTKGAETTVQALAAGAVAFVTKPSEGIKSFLESGADGIVAVVKSAARANLEALRAAAESAAAAGGANAGANGAKAASVAMARTSERVIALGVSTGGVQAIERVLRGLPATLPGIVVVQHMPAKFTSSFAQRLNRFSDLEVLEARDGDRVLPGRVLIAPGGLHTRLARDGAQYVVQVVDGPEINRHKPSVDVLFRSAAQAAGRNSIGVLMTGMGSDGARGLLEMRDAGGVTAAQDEASSIVFGMPKEAIRLGAASTVLPLGDIGAWLQRLCD